MSAVPQHLTVARLNLFEYARENPLRFVDPFGLQASLPKRICWQFPGDPQPTCSDKHGTPPTCVKDRTCHEVFDDCPAQWSCWVDWEVFRPCFMSGNTAPGPDPHGPPMPPNPPDRPGTRGTSPGGTAADGARRVISWATGCLVKARRCALVRGDCARCYVGGGNK